MKNPLNWWVRVELEDGSVWSVPVEPIARSRASYYKDEFDNDFGRSLLEDTIPLFEADPWQITEWAKNQMNPDDPEYFPPGSIQLVDPAPPTQLWEVWQGEWEVKGK